MLGTSCVFIHLIPTTTLKAGTITVPIAQAEVTDQRKESSSGGGSGGASPRGWHMGRSSVGRGMADGRDLRQEWVWNVTKSKEPGWLDGAARATASMGGPRPGRNGEKGEANHEGHADPCEGPHLGSG